MGSRQSVTSAEDPLAGHRRHRAESLAPTNTELRLRRMEELGAELAMDEEEEEKKRYALSPRLLSNVALTQGDKGRAISDTGHHQKSTTAASTPSKPIYSFSYSPLTPIKHGRNTAGDNNKEIIMNSAGRAQMSTIAPLESALPFIDSSAPLEWYSATAEPFVNSENSLHIMSDVTYPSYPHSGAQPATLFWCPSSPAVSPPSDFVQDDFLPPLFPPHDNEEREEVEKRGSPRRHVTIIDPYEACDRVYASTTSTL